MRPVFPAVWLSPRGIWLLALLGVLIAIASAVHLALAVAALGAAVLGAALLGDLWAGPPKGGIGVTRDSLGRLSLRRAASVTYRIENRGRSPLVVALMETPVAALAFERDLVRVNVPPLSRASAQQNVLPRERGPTALGPIYAWIENRAGLLRRRFRIDAPEELHVYPDLSAVEEYGLLARRTTLIESGLRRIRMRGIGTEFESIRDYGTGDEFRSISWKATARRGRLMVTRRETERSQHVMIALDCGRLMVPRLGDQRKFDFALTAALSVARIAQAADDHVGLFAFGARTRALVVPRRGRAHLAAMTRSIYGLQAQMEEPDYEAAFAELRRACGRRTLVVFFTDIFDPVAASVILATLGSLVPRHLPLCVLMNDAAIATVLAREPVDARGAYRTAVAMQLLDERRATIAQLRRAGIIVVDVPASRLTVAALDAYLDVKARGLL